MMTTSARRVLRGILDRANTALLQRSSLKSDQTPASSSNATGVVTTSALPTNPVDEIPVTEEPSPEGQWKKCVDKPFDCGFVHDMMSLEWGKFRDEVDELMAEMLEKQ